MATVREYAAKLGYNSFVATVNNNGDQIIGQRANRIFLAMTSTTLAINEGFWPGKRNPNLTTGMPATNSNILFYHDWGPLLSLEWRAFLPSGGPATFDVFEAWLLD